jgi:hypothetical protein
MIPKQLNPFSWLSTSRSRALAKKKSPPSGLRKHESPIVERLRNGRNVRNGDAFKSGNPLRSLPAFSQRQDTRETPVQAPRFMQQPSSKTISKLVEASTKSASAQVYDPRLPFSVCDLKVSQATKDLVLSIGTSVQATSQQVDLLEKQLHQADQKCHALRKTIAARRFDFLVLARGTANFYEGVKPAGHNAVPYAAAMLDKEDETTKALLNAHVAEQAAIDTKTTCANQLRVAKQSLQNALTAQKDLNQLVIKTTEIVTQGMNAAMAARAVRATIIAKRDALSEDKVERLVSKCAIRNKPVPVTPEMIEQKNRAEAKASVAVAALKKLVWLQKIVAREVGDPAVNSAAIAYMDLQIVQARNAELIAAAAAKTCGRLIDDIVRFESEPISPAATLPKRSNSPISTQAGAFEEIPMQSSNATPPEWTAATDYDETQSHGLIVDTEAELLFKCTNLHNLEGKSVDKMHASFNSKPTFPKLSAEGLNRTPIRVTKKADDFAFQVEGPESVRRSVHDQHGATRDSEAREAVEFPYLDEVPLRSKSEQIFHAILSPARSDYSVFTQASQFDEISIPFWNAISPARSDSSVSTQASPFDEFPRPFWNATPPAWTDAIDYDETHPSGVMIDSKADLFIAFTNLQQIKARKVDKIHASSNSKSTFSTMSGEGLNCTPIQVTGTKDNFALQVEAAEAAVRSADDQHEVTRDNEARAAVRLLASMAGDDDDALNPDEMTTPTVLNASPLRKRNLLRRLLPKLPFHAFR